MEAPKKLKNWLRPLFRSRTDNACHQRPNPSCETVPLIWIQIHKSAKSIGNTITDMITFPIIFSKVCGKKGCWDLFLWRKEPDPTTRYRDSRDLTTQHWRGMSLNIGIDKNANIYGYVLHRNPHFSMHRFRLMHLYYWKPNIIWYPLVL